MALAPTIEGIHEGIAGNGSGGTTGRYRGFTLASQKDCRFILEETYQQQEGDAHQLGYHPWHA